MPTPLKVYRVSAEDNTRLKGLVNLLRIDMSNRQEDADCLRRDPYTAVGRFVMSCQVWNRCRISWR
jgi:hypothetical protein